jgi:hypothetical protein
MQRHVTEQACPAKRRARTVLIAGLMALGASGVSASAMEPPAPAAQERFGCVDGHDNAIGGHPGAAGLADAAPQVAELTGNPAPTAWNAVANAEPIELGGC